MSDPDREILTDDEDQRDQDDGKKGRKFEAKDDEDALYRELGEKADIPDDFKDFLLNLKKALVVRDMDKLKRLYEHELETLTDKYFKATVCPPPNVVMQLIAEEDDRGGREDKYFEILYKELYFRHVYKVGPTVDDRFDSFDNYIDLLDLILALKTEKPAIELPLQWLWDVLDEFIYQFRSFHQFRREFRQHNLSEQNIEQIKQHQHLWSAQTVIEYLHELAKKGGVDITKSWSRKGDEKVQQQGSYPEFFVALSQFALIGLSRVYCSIGDYTSSIKVLDPIDLTNKTKSPFNSVMSAKVTIHYYLGFAYLMLRRYADAVKTFSYFLVYLNRKLGKYSRTVERKSQKMSGLLAIANSLSPQNLDDSLHASQDKLKNRGYEAIFQEAAPKFINPAPPDYDTVDTSPSVGQLQKMIFLNEIKQRSNLQHTYGYLKMCTNVHISKLADFLHFESEKEQEKEREKEEQRQKEEERSRARQAGILEGEGKEDHKDKDTKDKEKKEKKEKKERGTEAPKHKDEDTATVLLKLKHKTRNLRWASGGPSSSGRWVSSSEVDFYLEKDVVVISEHRPVRPYGDFFIKNTIKYQELIDDLQQK